MIAVVQRVSEASVTVGGEVVGEIGPGLVALVAVARDDSNADIDWMARKLLGVRIFPNAAGDKHFDIDVKAAGGGVLLVSNFTVAGATRQGRRPSFDAAADPGKGGEYFDQLVRTVCESGVPVQTGRFGADMLVRISNDGPVTLVLDSRKSREV
jgi:D-tyrosyl-tRNA(Tyr) deacylase